jgi:hypothetical protein
MAGNPNYAGIFTSTIESRTRKLADNVGKNNALLYKLREKDNVKTVSGGSKILQEIDFTENTSSGWYSGWDVLTVLPTDTITAAEYAIKEAYVTMAISGLEMAQNRGKEQMLDLMEADRRARLPRGQRARYRHRGQHQPRNRDVVAQPEQERHDGLRWREDEHEHS